MELSSLYEAAPGPRFVFNDRSVHISGMTQHASPRLPRGRPREFDTDAAVERAMAVFWSAGYHGTSLPDLLKATALSRGSLYAAFGDKHGLFLRALDRYIDDALARLDRRARSTEKCLSRRAEVPGRLCRSHERRRRQARRLVVATAMELAAHDPEVEQRIRRFFRAMETRLTEALARAQASGELADGVDPRIAARLLVCLVEGMRVVAKTGSDRATSQAVVKTLIDRFAA